ncbi:kinase-like domain-containing protein [Rhizophagus clarus]|uniref:Kinase-like domain-containing protein n=1 Tax=Rhizophagus clarus TaxID=94130 RepID=A0A8H3L8I7_9GLOM|nr:kinase-like domain-containing protein [Rhizophagus clarus]
MTKNCFVNICFTINGKRIIKGNAFSINVMLSDDKKYIKIKKRGNYMGRNNFINDNCLINGQKVFDKYNKENMGRKNFSNDDWKINGKRGSALKRIILAIIIVIFVERDYLITMFAPYIIGLILIRIMPKLSLELNNKEMIAYIIVSNLLHISSKWIEMRLLIIAHLLILIIYFLTKICLRNLRIRRMIKIDRDLNIDDRKEKYRDCEVICEKNWKHRIHHYYCTDCLNEEKDDREQNRLRYGICKECLRPNTGKIIWCSFCNVNHLQQDFSKWTSGNEGIDELIKNSQLNASSTDGIIEWIPYNKFTDIKYVAERGFSKVYSANWIDAYIRGWDHETNNWKRKERKKVALKVLNDSKNISEAFLNELKSLVKLAKLRPLIVPFYGISQNPDTKNFILVFKYIENNFHNIREFSPLTLLEGRLLNICISLCLIHLNNLVHRDLHLGNILHDDKHTYISDFGLCRPANETNDQNIYGVLPYIGGV